jgi:hypothetical protein
MASLIVSHIPVPVTVESVTLSGTSVKTSFSTIPAEPAPAARSHKLTPQQFDTAQACGRIVALALALAGLLCSLWLAGCAGGGGSSPLNSSGVPVVSTAGNSGGSTASAPATPCPVGTTGIPPNCTAPTVTPPPSCPAGQSLVVNGNCCPTGDTYSATTDACVPPVAPAPSCPSGQTLQGGGEYCCPNADTFNGMVCVAPPPVVTPPPNQPPNQPPTAPPTGPISCAPLVLVNGECVPPPTLTVLMQLDPTTVVDNSAGTTPATESVLSWSVTSTLAGDNSFCTDANGNTVSSPTSVGPYPAAQDGAVTITIACEDIYTARQSASIVLTVVPPPAAPADQFACTLNADGSVTCTWVAYEPAAECYVEQLSTGNVLAGQSGGSTGNVSSNTLFQPDQFQLYCNTGTTASPNPISVTP